MAILTVTDLTITADAPLVNRVSFDINKSEILALVGESGSGKTLTASAIMGLLPQGLRQSGEVVFEEGERWGVNGERKTPSTAHHPPITTLRGREIGMIFQEPMTSLNPLHTIEKQIGEAVRIGRRSQKSGIRKRVCELLDKVGLAYFKDRLNAYPHELSGGERQRVMIAMAIANNPQLLIADEPTTALDVTISAQILALLKELQQSMGMAVLLITHDLTIVKRVADRIAVMSHGKIVEMGKTADIFANPRHAYTKSLLAAELTNAPLTAPKDTAPLLECRQISVAYTQKAGIFSWRGAAQNVLSDIALSVPSHMTLGIVGESGSGKTSLALAILRLIASEGEILFEGKRIDTLSGAALRPIRKEMQVVFQDPYSSLNPRMTISAIVREGLDVHAPDMTRDEKEARVEAALKEVGLLPEHSQRYPHMFSGGQRQRVSIARALILKPKLILLDEPTSALDLGVQAQMLTLLKGLQEKYGLSYIFISHDLRVIRALSHWVMVLQKGRVVESASAQEIFNAPQQAYTQALLKAAFNP